MINHLKYKCQIDVNASWHAIDHTANGFAMTLAESGQREDVSKRVTHLCWWVRGLMMAMSTATAIAVLVVVIAAFTMVMTTTLTTACQVLDEVLYLFFRSLTDWKVLYDKPFKVQSQIRMNQALTTQKTNSGYMIIQMTAIG